MSKALFETKNNDTIVGNEAYFKGTLTTKGSVLVDGRVEGSIFEAKAVNIGKNGKVTGDINCESCCISGGDIKTKRMLMEEGSLFNGHCSMGQTGSGDAAVKPVQTVEESK
jgi:cytoskeletal protein CcmA (bactofilin family)